MPILLCFLFLQIGTACKKESGPAIDNPVILAQKLTELQAKSSLPGFAVSVIKGDSVYFQQGFGYADRTAKTPYTPQTIQPVGSVSKTFIGLALMRGIEMGLFTLEMEINDLLPFAVTSPNFPGQPIKLKHLATHTSGIVDNPDFYLKTYELGKVPSLALGSFMQQYFTPGGQFYAAANFANAAPDQQYNYSNIGAALAAHIIELKTGQPFDVFTKNMIFGPLGMASTHWFYDGTKASEYATLYEINTQSEPLFDQLLNADRSVKTYCSITYPDGSLKTSCADLTKYLVEMVKGFSKNGGSLLTDGSYEILFAPRYAVDNLPTDMDPKEPNRAVFWAITKAGRVSHTGGDPGIAAFISFNPVTKTGRIVTLNANLDGDDNVKTVGEFTEIGKAIAEFETSLK